MDILCEAVDIVCKFSDIGLCKLLIRVVNFELKRHKILNIFILYIYLFDERKKYYVICVKFGEGKKLKNSNITEKLDIIKDAHKMISRLYHMKDADDIFDFGISDYHGSIPIIDFNKKPLYINVSNLKKNIYIITENSLKFLKIY